MNTVEGILTPPQRVRRRVYCRPRSVNRQRPSGKRQLSSVYCQLPLVNRQPPGALRSSVVRGPDSRHGLPGQNPPPTPPSDMRSRSKGGVRTRAARPQAPVVMTLGTMPRICMLPNQPGPPTDRPPLCATWNYPPLPGVAYSYPPLVVCCRKGKHKHCRAILAPGARHAWRACCCPHNNALHLRLVMRLPCHVPPVAGHRFLFCAAVPHVSMTGAPPLPPAVSLGGAPPTLSTEMCAVGLLCATHPHL